MRDRRGAHDPGRVVRDLAVMLDDGGEALSDLGPVREAETLDALRAGFRSIWQGFC